MNSMFKNSCPEAVGIRIGSCILALSMLIVGIILSLFGSESGEKDDRVYKGSITQIYTNSQYSITEEQAMFKFQPASNSYYSVRMNSDTSGKIYVLNENSQQEIQDADYELYRTFSAVSVRTFSTYLEKNQTYYIYVEMDSDDVSATVEIYK